MYVYIERNYFSFSNNNTNIFHNMIETSSEKNQIKIKPIIRSSISRIKRNNPSNVKVIKATNNRGRNYARQTVCFILFRAWYHTRAPLLRDKRQPTDDRSKKTTFLALGGFPFRMIARFYVFIPVLCCNLLLYSWYSFSCRELNVNLKLVMRRDISVKYYLGFSSCHPRNKPIWNMHAARDRKSGRKCYAQRTPLRFTRKCNWSSYDWKSLLSAKFWE